MVGVQITRYVRKCAWSSERLSSSRTGMKCCAMKRLTEVSGYVTVSSARHPAQDSFEKSAKMRRRSRSARLRAPATSVSHTMMSLSMGVLSRRDCVFDILYRCEGWESSNEREVSQA